MSPHVLVLTTFPDSAIATRLAKEIVKSRLAACVNIMPQAQSVYMWQGEQCTETECIALMKTTESGYKKLQSYLQNHHPYELPEIIATPITKGLDRYLGWVTESVSI